MSDDISAQPPPLPDQPPPAPTPRRERPPLIELAEAAGFVVSAPVDEDLLADHARRWTSRAILVAFLLLAALNSPSIQTWATTLPPTWGSQTIDDLAEVWTSRLEQLGLDQPRAVVHEHYQAFQQLHWHEVLHALRLRRPPGGGPSRRR